MWIAKGTLLGIWLLSFGTIAYFVFGLKAVPKPNVTIDVRTYSFSTVANPSWWLWLLACLSLGLIAARSWPGKPILWLGLAVTELFPLGLLALFLVLFLKARQDP
jgi:hypothetical protein